MHEDEPPCDGCERAGAEEDELLQANEMTWRVWLAAHEMGRDGWSGRMRLEALTASARAEGAPRRTIEEAMELERHLWPLIKPKEPEEVPDGRAKERR